MNNAILKVSHYYPFACPLRSIRGLQHQGYVDTHQIFPGIIGVGKVELFPVRNYLDDSYRYTFGGKEEQLELGLNWLDFHARNYMPDLGRWMSVDPLAEGRPEMTPYHFMSNNPTNRIDLDGRSDDWVQNADGEIYWDKNATSQATTKAGETYLGRDLTFTFNSYIDSDLWDGPLGSFPAGDKLTSTINLTSNTDADNNLLSVDIKSSYKVNATGNVPFLLQGNDYFPGQKNVALNIKGATSGYATFEQHAKVNGLEAFGLGTMGYDKVNVAQKLTLGLNGNKLSVISSTDIFPSATLSVNGTQLFKYNQPSFKATHSIEKKLIDYRMPRNKLNDGLIPKYQYNHLRPAPAFYQRYNR